MNQYQVGIESSFQRKKGNPVSGKAESWNMIENGTGRLSRDENVWEILEGYYEELNNVERW